MTMIEEVTAERDELRDTLNRLRARCLWEIAVCEEGARYCAEINDGASLRLAEARGWAWQEVRHLITP